ncbi:glycosyltransferase family 2 protein [Granulicella sp. S190]|uniref:glycosyltransferase n=1 Tax=Granulicella sp. S190 TaxID=1747226 RepID=UPI00131E5E71|nr:glycosyltransferase family 2 protein [Granulicella sp. S190]
MSNTDPQLDPKSAETADLELSVIIPARNEQRSLPTCLASLLSQSEPGFLLGQQWELIIVNDDSTDDTRRIAAEAAATHEGVVLLDAPKLDLSSNGGFTGKNNACWAGVQAARGRFFLFTDADTTHETNDISRSLREADRHHAAMLSYSPRQVVTGFWQHAVMPLVFSELASVYPSKLVNDPVQRLAAANGQFLLVEREAYFAVGGHRAVGKNVLEDVALAENLKHGSHAIRFRYAPEAVSTRMYWTTSEMTEGWTKNFALLFPKPVALALWRVLDLLLFFGLPVAAFGLYWLQPWQRNVILLIWVRTLWRFYSRVARSNFPALDVAVSILGVPLFIYLLLRSVVHYRFKKNVTWKGRNYNTAA